MLARHGIWPAYEAITDDLQMEASGGRARKNVVRSVDGGYAAAAACWLIAVHGHNRHATTRNPETIRETSRALPQRVEEGAEARPLPAVADALAFRPVPVHHHRPRAVQAAVLSVDAVGGILARRQL